MGFEICGNRLTVKKETHFCKTLEGMTLSLGLNRAVSVLLS